MSDTSPEAAKIQAGIHRRVTGAQRLRLALEMSETRYAFGSAPLPEPLR